ncbi:sulfur oxidation c-type cytochrome SoxX [Flavimaricola marinus]|uniref:Cytochrome c n=1 Tax=Flavimaricola marinus TaxID=1819565 RepID=A0A238LH58_9RHOB|nr:sulfur oxidation c-type cytochrome SoxX [Flavimaricola marinus]SMY08912.1 Cytochrome c [Flavimaricola marinus]
MRHPAILAAGVAVFGTIVAADVVAPSSVVFGDYGAVEMSLSGQPGDPVSGLAVMETKGSGNCVACHQISTSEAAFQGNVGPPLDGVGGRWSTEELRGIVANAKMVFPDSVMPSFYRVDGYTRPGDAFTGKAAAGELDPLLTAQQIEDVVAYLATLTD